MSSEPASISQVALLVDDQLRHQNINMLFDRLVPFPRKCTMIGFLVTEPDQASALTRTGFMFGVVVVLNCDILGPAT